MRKVIFLVLLVVSIQSFAQNDTTKYLRSNDYGWIYKRLLAGSALGLPGDTTLNKVVNSLASINGKIYVKSQYSWDAIPTGNFKASNDSSFNTGFTTRGRLKQYGDSLAATEKNVSDSLYNDGYTRRDRVKQGLDSLGVSVGNALALKLNISDTSGKWVGLGWLMSLAKYADTSSMLNAYKTGIIALNADTATIQPRFINQTNLSATKVNIGDTSSMLNTYYKTYVANAALALKLNISDTSGKWVGLGWLPSFANVNSSYSNPSWIADLNASKINQTSSYRFTTDAEKSTWNSKESALIFSTGLNRTGNIITNLISQYTDALARASLSFVAGSGGYNSTTGVITIPTNTNQLTNGAGFLTGNQTITLSGEVSGSGATAITTTVANSAVIGKVLTGYVSGAGIVAATDNILQAIQKLNGNISALVTGVSTVFGRSGTIVATSGDYNTSQVTENTNLYYTNARVNTQLNGYSGDVTFLNGVSAIGALKVTNAMLAGTIDYAKMNAATVPTWNQNTIGTAANITATSNVTLTTLSSLTTAAGGAFGSNAFNSTAFLPLTGGTLTGALNGTSASFTGNLTAVAGNFGDVVHISTANQTNSRLRITNTATGGKSYAWVAGHVNVDQTGFGLYNITDGTDVLYFNTSGAATFSSSVTASNAFFNGIATNGTPSSQGASANFVEFRNTGGDFYIGQEGSSAGGFFTGSSAYASILYSGTAQEFIIGGVRRLQIASTGAATFSSSVTASSLMKSGGTSAQILAADGSVITAGTNITISGGTISSTGGGGGGISGSGVANQLTYWSGTSAIQGSTTLTYNTSGNVGMTVSPSLLAASAIARGVNITPTLTAAANNDVLVGLDIAPTFTNGAFTGVTNFGIRVINSGINNTYTGVTSGVTPLGLVLSNTTPAVSGSTQNSPFILLQGQSFFTSSRQANIRLYNGTSGTLSSFVIDDDLISNPTIKQNIFVVKQASNALGGDLTFINSITQGVNTINLATSFRTLFNNTIVAVAGVFNNSGNNASPRGTSFLDVVGQGNMNSLTIGTAGVSTASSILTVSSTTQGFLLPRMTTTQRDAIATPATGLQVYNTTTNTNDYYNGSAWSTGAYSGSYTPTLTNFSGASAMTVNSASFIRIGNIVTVTVFFNFTAASTFSGVYISVPVGANFSSSTQARGSGSGVNGTSVIRVTSASTTNTVLAEITTVGAGTTDASLTFQYNVQ